MSGWGLRSLTSASSSSNLTFQVMIVGITLLLSSAWEPVIIDHVWSNSDQVKGRTDYWQAGWTRNHSKTKQHPWLATWWTATSLDYSGLPTLGHFRIRKCDVELVRINLTGCITFHTNNNGWQSRDALVHKTEISGSVILLDGCFQLFC